MTNKLQSSIKEVLERTGALGVNALQKELGGDVPLSTLQKYLHEQTYFRKTPQRKWDLPARVADPAFIDYSKIIESQVTGINALFDLISSQLNSTLALMSAQQPTNSTPAEKESPIHPRLQELDTNVKHSQALFKKYVRVCPEEYQYLLKNLDLYSLIINKGTEYMNESFNVEISALFLEKTDTLSDSILKTLKEHQNVQY